MKTIKFYFICILTFVKTLLSLRSQYTRIKSFCLMRSVTLKLNFFAHTHVFQTQRNRTFAILKLKLASTSTWTYHSRAPPQHRTSHVHNTTHTKAKAFQLGWQSESRALNNTQPQPEICYVDGLSYICVPLSWFGGVATDRRLRTVYKWDFDNYTIRDECGGNI